MFISVIVYTLKEASTFKHNPPIRAASYNFEIK